MIFESKQLDPGVLKAVAWVCDYIQYWLWGDSYKARSSIGVKRPKTYPSG